MYRCVVRLPSWSKNPLMLGAWTDYGSAERTKKLVETMATRGGHALLVEVEFDPRST